MFGHLQEWSRTQSPTSRAFPPLPTTPSASLPKSLEYSTFYVSLYLSHFIQLSKRNQNSFCISITLYIVNLIWFLASQVCWGVAINWSDQASCWSLCCEGGESAREGWEERSQKWSILFLEWTSKSVLKVQCCVCPTHNPPNFRCRRRLRDERSRALSFIRKLLLCVGEALLT